MKFTKIFLIGFQILLAVGSAFSQNISAGIRTGATYFTINNDLFNADAKYTMGLDLAIPVEFRLSPVFSLQPELHFTQKGVAFEGIEDGLDQTITFRTNYLELPVLLKANYGSEKFKCYAFVAPSVGFAAKRFVTEKLGDADLVKEDIEFLSSGDIQDQRWEMNAIGGIGGSVKAGIGSVVLDVRYSYGLTDDTKFEGDRPEDWNKSSNRGCTLSVGYMVPLSRK